ncbi:MAG: GxxExxY protein [Chitinophagaceae bacterium]|nr:MAG: GxxExxY protein [Chitinophagaceae bacterium]
MTENEIATIIVDVAIQIHKQYGPGLLERVYEEIMAYELRKRGLFVEQQKMISLRHAELVLKHSFRADLIVEHIVLVELKSAEQMSRTFSKVVHTYLKLTGIKLGLLMNFHVTLMKDGIQRIVNGL